MPRLQLGEHVPGTRCPRDPFTSPAVRGTLALALQKDTPAQTAGRPPRRAAPATPAPNNRCGAGERSATGRRPPSGPGLAARTGGFAARTGWGDSGASSVEGFVDRRGLG